MAKPIQIRESQTRRNEAVLEVRADAFSDETIQNLVEDWIVPLIVDEIIDKVLQSRE